MQIYSKSMKNATSLSFLGQFWLFVFSDRAWCGLQNFYTELWNSLIMQIYAHLFKINEKCHLSSIQKSQQICTWGGDIYYASRNLLSTCLNMWPSLILVLVVHVYLIGLNPKLLHRSLKSHFCNAPKPRSFHYYFYLWMPNRKNYHAI